MTFMGALKTRVKLLAPHIVGDFKLPLFLYVALWGVFDFPPHISRTFVDRSERLFGSLDRMLQVCYRMLFSFFQGIWLSGHCTRLGCK